MSNSPSPAVLRVSPSALIFILLMLLLGALLVGSTRIDPKALVRPEFTPEQQTFKNTDGSIQFDYPSNFSAQEVNNSQAPVFQYSVISTTNAQQGFLISTGETHSLNQNLADNTTPEDFIKSVFSNASTPLNIQPAQVGALKGSKVHVTVPQTNQQTGQTVNVDVELWVLSLDSAHSLIILANVPSSQWSGLQPAFTRVVDSLKVDAPAAVKALTDAFGPAAALATAPASTPAATTAASTAQPTAVSTALATQASF